MLGGFGSINHMIVTLRNNKRLLSSKQSYFKLKNYTSIKQEYCKAAGASFNIKKASPKQLKLVREKVINKRKRQTRNLAIFLCVAMPLICFGLYKAFHNFSFGFPQSNEISEASIQKNNEEKYFFYLEDGDQWLSKKNYYNAVFQYKKALELYPNDFDANYRLALGYSYQCQYKFENCEIGMQLILKLENDFPKKKEIQDIKAVFVHWGI